MGSELITFWCHIQHNALVRSLYTCTYTVYIHIHNAVQDLKYQDRLYLHNLETFEDLCLEAAIKDLRKVTESHES